MVRIIAGSTAGGGGTPSPCYGLFAPRQVGLMTTGILQMVVAQELVVIVEFFSSFSFLIPFDGNVILVLRIWSLLLLLEITPSFDRFIFIVFY